MEIINQRIRNLAKLCDLRWKKIQKTNEPIIQSYKNCILKTLPEPNLYMCMRMNECMNVCMYVCVYIYIFICVCVCTSVSVFV